MTADAPAPLVREIPYADPVALAGALAGDGHVGLLHSAVGGERGRHSFIALEPFRVIRCEDGRTTVDGAHVDGSPWDVLRDQLAACPLAPAAGAGPFAGGAVGWLGYELGGWLEPAPAPPPDALDLPEMAMMFCDVVVAVDHRERRARILSSGLPERDAAARRARARRRLEHVASRLAATGPLPPPPRPAAPPELRSTFTRVGYEAAVRRVIGYILAGDVFQANLAQRFAAPLPAGLSPFDLFRRLTAANPAPFAAYLRFGDVAVASSSPERFLRIARGAVETRPIKGTRPRGADPAEDDALAAELAASEKDRAENVMIVDLLRNDLSRVCRDDGVEVTELCAVERFATVMHLVSAVTGRLRPGVGALDALAACFPGGSITGAPKIRAREIIAELEPVRRGPYCGAIGWIGFDGALDTSIAIRTFAIRDGVATFGAGGGVVADSTPAGEYEETLAKARALVAALSP
ncbi:aminodeoxychorismate synthase component I [Miltoncostaea marina]|uniref:aminodeoxychorismate synthase component I n=1 Tax=Miltoncostaea marina TaxID=2843215 RepID=UPI001C3CF2F9|nr:aminodeoxychorismate synthase component I [Miltoncostaea marina]